jgi:hypothetical protein
MKTCNMQIISNRSKRTPIKNNFPRHPIFSYSEDSNWIAIKPTLPGFCRRDHRVTASLRVPGGVTVGRTVATQRRATGLAGTQMYPSITDFHSSHTWRCAHLTDVIALIWLQDEPDVWCLHFMCRTWSTNEIVFDHFARSIFRSGRCKDHVKKRKSSSPTRNR